MERESESESESKCKSLSEKSVQQQTGMGE